MANDLTKVETGGISQSFAELKKLLADEVAFEKKIAEEIETTRNDIREKGAKERYNIFKEYALKEANETLKQEESAINAAVKAELDKNKQLSKLKDSFKKATTKAERDAIQKAINDEIKAVQKKYKDLENLDAKSRKALEQARKKQDRQSKIDQAKKDKEYTKEQSQALGNAMFGKGQTLAERGRAIANAFHQNEDGSLNMAAGLATMANAISDFAKQLNNQINTVAGYKTAIDTRLQGLNSKYANYAGSYWDKMSLDFTGIAGVSPLVRQEKIAENLKAMVGRGIAFNVEQRAFLQTIKDKIADTFDATNTALLRLIRIQQQDTTAARLGMESALTSFLNNMYETTEYMTDAMSSIKNSLLEAEALMGTKSAAAFEYQVQKWIGSMYSVGMSQSGVEGIAGALGQLAAGQISGITSNYGNLLVMAAGNAGISIADALANGLNESQTNKLMAAMVTYLKGIYEDTRSSKVVQQQYANVFGLTAADLRAIANLSTGDVYNIAGNGLSYTGMIQQLNNMANNMYKRTSMGEMMTNAFANLKYTMSAGIANNPALYATYTIASLLEDMVGGIKLPDIKVMGSGVNLQTSIAQLMNVAALSGSILSGIGQMISAGTGGGFSGSSMLRALGIGNNTASVTRGTGSGLLNTGGISYSESGFVGNTESSDVYGKTMSDANDDANKQMAEAKDESNDITMGDVDNHIMTIYQLLDDVVNGTSSFHVIMSDSGPWTGPYRP